MAAKNEQHGEDHDANQTESHAPDAVKENSDRVLVPSHRDIGWQNSRQETVRNMQPSRAA